MRIYTALLTLLLSISTAFAGQKNFSGVPELNSVFSGNQTKGVKFVLPKLTPQESPHPLPDNKEKQAWGDSNVEKALADKGVLGLIHGGVETGRGYLMAVHSPDNFFDFRIYPLRPGSKEIAQKIADLKLERHDRVRVMGKFDDNPPHIVVSGIELVKADPTDFSNQEYDKKLALDLADKGSVEIVGLVHGVLRDGSQVAIEYKNTVLPLRLEDADDASAAQKLQELWRGDAIKVTVKLAKVPGRPPHLIFDAAKDLTVLERVKDFQNKEWDVKGPLVLFTKSPITRMDVWAIEMKNETIGVTRYFTLNNFADKDKWDAMYAELRKAWDARKDTALQGRNKFINTKLIVRAKGTIITLAEDPKLAQNQANQTLQVEEYEILP